MCHTLHEVSACQEWQLCTATIQAIGMATAGQTVQQAPAFGDTSKTAVRDLLNAAKPLITVALKAIDQAGPIINKSIVQVSQAQSPRPTHRHPARPPLALRCASALLLLSALFAVQHSTVMLRIRGSAWLEHPAPASSSHVRASALLDALAASQHLAHVAGQEGMGKASSVSP